MFILFILKNELSIKQLEACVAKRSLIAILRLGAIFEVQYCKPAGQVVMILGEVLFLSSLETEKLYIFMALPRKLLLKREK